MREEIVGCVHVTLVRLDWGGWEIRSVEITTGEVISASTGGISEGEAVERYERLLGMWQAARRGGPGVSSEMAHYVRDAEPPSDSVN